jgi:hypothetical protein
MKLLKLLLEEEQPTIENLQKEIQRLKDRNEYEVNKYELLLEDLRAGLVDSIQKHTKIVFEDMTFIAKERVPEEPGKELLRWIKNLEQYFEDLKK